MVDSAIHAVHDYLPDASLHFLELIKGDNPDSFTRLRKLSVLDIIYQMFDRKGCSQWSDIMNFYDDLNKKQMITETGFYLARKKFNPEALRVMSNEFIANFYDNNADEMKKWKNHLVLSVDGSKIILPNTKENEAIFGRINAKPTSKDFDSKPVSGLLSTLHDCLNDTFLDVKFGPCSSSEKYFASKHITTYCENFIDSAIFTLDRGYPSMRLVDQLINSKQYFVFRLPSSFLKAYTNQIKAGEDKVIHITFDRESTNQYRDDIQFRQHLMNTTYTLRFTKLIIGQDKDDQDIVELLMSNLPEDEYSKDDLKELYHLRWTIETSYNRLKNRMKLENFSGYKSTLIYQDIYADIWLYNIISLEILYANDQVAIEQKQEGEYILKRNFNKAIGIMKKLFIRALISMDEDTNDYALSVIKDNIAGNLVWIKKGRAYERKRTTTPSSISYKSTY